MTDSERAVSLLTSDRCSLVLCRGEQDITVTGRGISPLLDLYDSGRCLRGASVADLVVGRAAAFIFIAAGVASVHGAVMSTGADALLERYGIPHSYDTLAPQIINRAGDGICPMEDAVSACVSPVEALPAIRSRRDALRH